MTTPRNLDQNDVFRIVDIAAQYTEDSLEHIAGRQWSSLDSLVHTINDHIPAKDQELFLEHVTNPMFF